MPRKIMCRLSIIRIYIGVPPVRAATVLKTGFFQANGPSSSDGAISQGQDHACLSLWIPLPKETPLLKEMPLPKSTPMLKGALAPREARLPEKERLPGEIPLLKGGPLPGKAQPPGKAPPLKGMLLPREIPLPNALTASGFRISLRF